jgi:hypothetical protein
MWFGKKNAPLPTGVISTSEGSELEVVTSYKYVGVWLDGTLSICQHISKLQAKVKSSLGFLYRNRSFFTPAIDLNLVQMTILPQLDYGDVIYRSAGKGATNAPYRTHHSTLYSSVNWSTLYTHRKTHWLMLIYKTLLGLTPSYLRYLLQPSSSTYNTCIASHILLKVPEAHTSLGSSSFQFAAVSDWNKLQQTLKLDSFISISSFKDSIMDTLTDSCGCFA